MADGYQTQLGVTGGPQLSGADPEAFGAAVGRGLEQAGTTIDNAIHQYRERERDTQAASAGVALAQASTKLDELSTDARDQAAPGGAGHTATITGSFNDIAQQNLAQIKDPHIRQIFQQRYAELGDRVTTREYGWEATQRVNKLVSDVDDQGTVYANAQVTSPNPSSFVQAQHDVATTIGALNVSEDIKDKALKEQQRKIAVAFGNGLQEKNPHALIQALDSGQLNEYLQPEDIKTLRSGGMVEIRRLDAEARQRQTLEESQVRETGQELINRVNKGDLTVTPDEIKTARAGAQKFGLKELDFNLGDAGDKFAVAKETRTWNPVTWHQQINDLQTKAAAGKITQPESIRLRHLTEAAPDAIAKFNSDPHAAAAAAGNPAPPLDPNDPKSIQARVTWARSYAAASGLDNVPYLNIDEMKGLRDRLHQNAAGQVDVATELRQHFGVGVGTEIARQLDPSDKTTQLFVGLEPQAAVLVRNGMDALKRNPKLFAGGEGDADRAREIWADYAPGIPAELQGPISEAAKNITAAAGDKVHRASLEGAEFEATYRNSIQRAAGQIGTGNAATGGFVNWNGRRAWLPTTMGQTQFQQQISRAGPEQWKKAGGGVPYYMGSNGKLTPLTDDQLKSLGRNQLESVSPGVYHVLGVDQNRLVDKTGRNYWTFDVRKLGH